MNEEILNEFESLFEISEAPKNIIEDFNIIKNYIDNLQQENKQLKEELEKIKQPTIFIDTEDMEERYGEQLYQDYLEEQNKDLKDRINKAIETFENEIKSLKEKKKLIMALITPENGYLTADIEFEIKRIEKYLEILKGGDKE